jgi:NitT/TauT family transport system ATP-binding protein
MTSIELNNVSMDYLSDDSKTQAVKDVSLNAKSGEFISIIGPSGCGKSTLIDIVAGIKKPSKGNVKVGDKIVENPSPDVGIVFQDYSLFPWMTAYDNLYLAISNNQKDLSKKEIDEKVKVHLEIVGLSKFSKKFPNTLSGGMRQRLAISRMFSIDPEVFLMDEPFGALDALNRIHMQDLLLNLWYNGKKRQTTLYVTHDVDEAIYLSDRIVVMTPSPGSIKEIIDVPFKRPRDRISLSKNVEYTDLRNYLMSLLNEEMILALNQQKQSVSEYYDFQI